MSDCNSHGRHFAVIQNIPSPYRLHLFSELHRQLTERGIAFHVHFMSRGHVRRPAAWRDPEIGFPHTYWRDYGFLTRRMCCHFNLGMLACLQRQRSPDYLLVGSPWDTLTGICASLLLHCRTGILWTEGNTRTPGQLDGAVGAFKRLVLSRFAFAAVPGEEGCRYVALHQARTRRKMPVPVLLPNLVDERRFRPRANWSPAEIAQARSRIGAQPGSRIAICPARIEPVKGLCEFFALLSPELLQGWQVAIIGEGSQVLQLQDVLRARRIEAHVQVIPYIPYGEMPVLYAAADLFLLPSRHDPNPLSVVEAMHSGLPLLLSDRVGNFPEALAEGGNGWGFSPVDAAAATHAAAQALGAPAGQLENMGRESQRRAQKYWGTAAAVARFLDAVGAAAEPAGERKGGARQ